MDMDVYGHFGLTGPPFAVTPDPRFAYGTEEHTLAITKITYSVQAHRGLFLLQGAIGTGKTTLGRFVLSEWSKREDFIAAHVNSPVTRSQAGFLREIMSAFGLATPRNLADIEAQLLSFLIDAQKKGKTVVLLLDEAHLTSPPNLDMLHRISNMQTLTEQLMQVVLLAQPNIVHKLEQRPALQSRITGGAYLGPLTFDDAIEMLRHRIGVVANDDDSVFDKIFLPESHHAIYDATHGICRDLCVCADGALIDAFARRQPAVSARTIQTVAKDMRFKGWQIK
jgi:general secretion pathway protein A